MPKPARREVPDMRPFRDAVVARLTAKSAREGECIVWAGWRNRLGYGNLSFHNRQWMAHRLLYAALHGPFDPNMDILHACDNPACITGTHLKLGTIRDNMRDMRDKGRDYQSQKTHCPRGHAFEEHGRLYLATDPSKPGYKPWRACRACARINQRIRAGWPEELALTLPPVPQGQRTVNAKWDRLRSRESDAHG